jgi:7-keto-8-aminopelargonate synthetase-like enzyme
MHLQACGGILERTLFMGTFGKALAGYGAYVAASSEVVETLAQSAPSFLFSTALPPPVVAGNLAALELVQSKDESHRPVKLARVAERFRSALRSQGCDIPEGRGPIIPWQLGSPERVLAVSAHLFDKGIHAPAIRPPTVPPNQCRLRLSVSCAFDESDIEEVAVACGSALSL